MTKVVINLATGLEDAERATVTFLVGGAAVEQGKQVTLFQRPQAESGRARRERAARRRVTPLGMDRR